MCQTDLKKELVLCVHHQDLLLKKKASRAMLVFMGDRDTLCVEFLLKNTQVAALRIAGSVMRNLCTLCPSYLHILKPYT